MQRVHLGAWLAAEDAGGDAGWLEVGPAAVARLGVGLGAGAGAGACDCLPSAALEAEAVPAAHSSSSSTAVITWKIIRGTASQL